MRDLPQQITQINPEHLAALHRHYFGDASDPGFCPPEAVITDIIFWANEGGASTAEIQDTLRLAGFVKDLFSPIRTYGLTVPDPDAEPEPTPKAAQPKEHLS